MLMLDGISYAPVNESTIHHWIYYLRSLNGLRFSEYTGWQTIADYMRLLHGKTAQNVAVHIPYANVRTLVCGFGERNPDDAQKQAIMHPIHQGMEAGAVGISTGLDYVDQWFATTEELTAACRELTSYQGIYVTHVRYVLGTLKGVQEAVEISKRAKVPVHISHLKGSSHAETEALIDYINRVAMNEVDFSFDVYPYVPSSTMLQFLLPYEVYLDGPLAALTKLCTPEVRSALAHRAGERSLDKTYIAWVASKQNEYFQGLSLQEYATAMGRPAEDALCELLIEEGMAVLLVFRPGDDQHVEPFLAHPRYMMGSDGILFTDGKIHPRQYGSAPRLLGTYVREKGLLSLEEAIYKLSGFPGQRFGLVKRGAIREGYFADIAIFDPDLITDRATYSDPHQVALGVMDVLVNGVPIIVDGIPTMEMVGSWPGRWLRFEGE